MPQKSPPRRGGIYTSGESRLLQFTLRVYPFDCAAKGIPFHAKPGRSVFSIARLPTDSAIEPNFRTAGRWRMMSNCLKQKSRRSKSSFAKCKNGFQINKRNKPVFFANNYTFSGRW